MALTRKSNMIFARATPETLAMMSELAQAWGPVIPLGDSDIIRESIRRAYVAEFPLDGVKKKSQKKSPAGA